MPRVGVSFDQVAATADAIVTEGGNPSILNVRERLGTGSCSTVQKHLSVWRESQPKIAASSFELPLSIIQAFSKEFDHVRAESRAAIEERLVVAQTEASVLAASGESMEVELDKLMEEISVLTAERDLLLSKCQGQVNEIERLTRENDRERHSADHARIEVAQLRNKLEIQAEKLLELNTDLIKIASEKSAESQVRTIAEKDSAVISVKLESEQEKTKALAMEKESLIIQLNETRQSAESARTESAKISNKLELQAVQLDEKISHIKELSEFYQAEKNALSAAVLENTVLMTRLEGLDKTITKQVSES